MNKKASFLQIEESHFFITLALATLISLIFGIILGILFVVFRPIQIEEDCQEKAMKITGEEKNSLVQPTEKEIKLYSYRKNDQLTLYYRNFLNCKNQAKFFYIF